MNSIVAAATIATIFVANVFSYAHGDMLLDSKVSAFNGTVVDDHGNIVAVQGKIIDIQMTYMSLFKNSPVQYDNVEWNVRAQSAGGEDVAIYDFSLNGANSDQQQPSAMTNNAELGNLLQNIMSPLMPVEMPDSGAAHPHRGKIATPQGATTTARSTTTTNGAFVQSGQSAGGVHKGSSRVKRSAHGDHANANENAPAPVPHHAANAAANTANSPVPADINNANISVPADANDTSIPVPVDTNNTSIPVPVDTNVTVPNNATHGTSGNVSETKIHKHTKNGTNTASGNTLIIPSWMAILVPSFVIICTRIG